MSEHSEHNQDQHNQEQSQDQHDQQLHQEQQHSEQTTQEPEHGSQQEAEQQDTEQQNSEQESQQTQGESQDPPAGTTSPSTLFGSNEMEEMKSEEQKKKEAEEADQKKRQETAKQTGSQKTYPAGTEFRYSGHSKILEEEMSESKIFEWVADDFPEIEKGRFTLRYDQNKGRLVPIPEAQKKGLSAVSTLQVNTLPPGTDQGEDDPRPPVYRLLCADGVYEVRNNLSGTYVVRLESGLTLAEGYYPSVPKAPARLLAETVRIFAERPDTEALIDIVYDRRSATFCLVWNQKRASVGEVEYQPLPDDDNLVLYAEIHSHHKMSAFYSPKDNNSEKPTGVYGVVGRITDEVPEARFRYSCGGHFRELFAEDLFDDPSVVAATVRRPEAGGLL